MQIGKPRATGKSTTSEQQEELLDCRMVMLGLQLNPAEIADNDALKEMMRRCMGCGYREACAVDLERDPNNPVWETLLSERRSACCACRGSVDNTIS